jgi:hypothetical protein
MPITGGRDEEQQQGQPILLVHDGSQYRPYQHDAKQTNDIWKVPHPRLMSRYP